MVTGRWDQSRAASMPGEKPASAAAPSGFGSHAQASAAGATYIGVDPLAVQQAMEAGEVTDGSESGTYFEEYSEEVNGGAL